MIFHLKAANDQIFPQVLSSPAGPIVDEQVFSADKVTPDDDIVKAKAFAGQYTITATSSTTWSQFKANPDYKGSWARRRPSNVNVEVLHRRVEPEARRAAGQHRRRVPQPVRDRHRQTCGPTRRSRSSTAPAARSATSSSTSTRCRTAPRPAECRRGQGARRASGGGRPRRPQRDRRPGLQGHLHAAVLLRSERPDRCHRRC